MESAVVRVAIASLPNRPSCCLALWVDPAPSRQQVVDSWCAAPLEGGPMITNQLADAVFRGEARFCPTNRAR